MATPGQISVAAQVIQQLLNPSHELLQELRVLKGQPHQSQQELGRDTASLPSTSQAESATSQTEPPTSTGGGMPQRSKNRTPHPPPPPPYMAA